jgi:glycosyltransferase involved in cell wall biosynthesis
MSSSMRAKALLIRVGTTDRQWWWPHVNHDALECELLVWPLLLSGGRPKTPFSWRFAQLAWRTTILLLRARRQRVAYVFTFENDWLTFIIASLQTLFMFRRPRHIILQFIMREKTPAVKSRMKYAFLRWCYRSVHLVVCSARPEAEYYRRAFVWPPNKVAFVPLHTDPAFTDRPAGEEQPFVLSAGRTFRDYQTLLEAARQGLSMPLTIVAGRESLSGLSIPANVTVHHDIPLTELLAMMARASIVVLPLQERKISIGQTVLLEAMAKGKAVVVTRVNGTVDYIDHMRNGLLVPPNDAQALRDAINTLADDRDLRRRIGDSGRDEVLRRHLPDHYAQGVADALKGLR